MWLHLLAFVAQAGESEYRAEWFELTCDDAVILASAKAKAAPACHGRKVGRTVVQYRPGTKGGGCEVWLHAWCDGTYVGTNTQGADPKVPTIYTDEGGGGTSLPLDVMEMDLGLAPMREGPDTWNDKAGSVKVPAGWTVRLCSEPGGAGRCADFTQAHPKLGNTYVGNDSASWVKVVKGTLPPVFACPRVFENDGYGGMFTEVCNDVSTWVGTPWNDKITSILLPGGWKVRACSETEFTGVCSDIDADVWNARDLSVGNDRITSMKILARGR